MDFLVEVVGRTMVGALTLYISMRIAREPLPFHDALWLAALPIALLVPIALALGYVLPYWAIRLLLAASLTLWFESFLLRVNARKHDLTLPMKKAYAVSFAYALGSMLVAPFALSLVLDRTQ